MGDMADFSMEDYGFSEDPDRLEELVVTAGSCGVCGETMTLDHGKFVHLLWGVVYDHEAVPRDRKHQK